MQDKHEIVAIAGAERRQIHNRYTNIYKYGYDESSLAFKGINEELFGIMIPNTQALFNSYTISRNKDEGFRDVIDRFVSFYANGSYTYNKKLTLSGSIRMDQSNLFGTDIKNQYKPLWSIGALYQLPKLNWEPLDRWAIRMTYGVNGNVPKDNGPYLISRVGKTVNPYSGELQATIDSPQIHYCAGNAHLYGMLDWIFLI
ncbi:TonB-dependent receptor [Sphingobacterium sp. E70]|uniref:TonB-dependent receptor domain-containing protein n=1 Tax=Sphingobacterium sp. E70 TaxID=2853439 RepID=UPI00211B8BD6|nr:TonB-dependent receptor [Sphingobacterium sp. E70]ULT28798.1 TonB-dependent receptor [Sphingobacterium sp. E70]